MNGFSISRPGPCLNIQAFFGGSAFLRVEAIASMLMLASGDIEEEALASACAKGEPGGDHE
jgi:hypothetical protein